MLNLQVCFINLWILVMVNIWLRLTERAAHAVFFGAYLTFNMFSSHGKWSHEVGNHFSSDVRLINVIMFF